MRTRAFELDQLPLILLDLLLNVLFVILNVNQLASHLGHYCPAIGKSGRGRARTALHLRDILRVYG